MKTMKIKMACCDGSFTHWTVLRVSGITNIALDRKSRKVSGWSIFDESGYERFIEGNWSDLVAAFKLISGNFGMTSTIS